jgi:hypothetical protein
MRGREGEGREDIWGGRGRRGRGFGGFDGVLVSLISFDSSGMVLGNHILVVEPAVMHMVPPFLSVFLGCSLSVSRFSNLEFFFGPGRVLLSNDEPLSFFAHCSFQSDAAARNVEGLEYCRRPSDQWDHRSLSLFSFAVTTTTKISYPS